MAVTCKVIECILLTCIALFVFREFRLSNSSFGHFIIILTPFVLFFLAWKQYGKISAYFARARMAEKPDRFSPGKIDCYVRFNGRMVAGNRVVLPLSGRECAFYLASIVAEWETKKKKPDKGVEAQLKPLFREQSADEFELVGKFDRVYIKAADFTKSWLLFRENEKSSARCPGKVTEQEQEKYKKYHVSEKFVRSGDMLVAQGRLVREADGRLFIKPTGRLKYPSFVVVKQRQNGSDQFIRSVAQQAVKDARLKQINTGALVLNALLLLFFNVL